MTRISYGSVTHNSVYALLVEMNPDSTYTEAYISCNGQTSGNLAPSRGSTTSYGWSFYGLSPSTTYTLSWSARTGAGSTASGSTTFTTQPPPRPSNWSWDISIYSGGTFNLTASQWNQFCSRINEFRRYKNLGNYGFTNAVQGTTVYAWQINNAINAIRDMNSNVPPTQSSGGYANAYIISNLTTALNNVY